MIGNIAFSIILYASAHTGQKCETVFQATALKVNPELKRNGELPYLQEMATAACQSTNPDIIWQIVSQESGFRFIIARDNSTKDGRIYRGLDAIRFLKRVHHTSSASPGKAANIDIGAMQFNWNWHKDAFGSNPIRMLSPTAQVEYLVDHFGDHVYQQCSNQWVGCYHNSTDRRRGERYQAAILKKGQILQLQTLYYLKNALQKMSPEQKRSVPRMKKKDLLHVLNLSKRVPVPKQLDTLFINSMSDASPLEPQLSASH